MSAPLLLVHGMCCTGDVWSNYRTYFEAKGHAVYTPTLRPELRLRRSPPKALGQLRVDDYVDDLEQVVDQIEAETGQTPAIIGHSMGGLLVQVLAQRGRGRAVVSVSPTPIPMVSPPVLSFITRLTEFGLRTRLGPRAVLPPAFMANRDVFNCVVPTERLGHWKAMVHESLSVFADFRNAHVDPKDVRMPALIVGCSRDRLVPAKWTRNTGAVYDGNKQEYREYKTHGHWFYSEPGWDETVKDIAGWLDQVN